jgi:hypothetical protein
MRNINVTSEREFRFRNDEDRWIYTSEIRYSDGYYCTYTLREALRLCLTSVTLTGYVPLCVCVCV